jgi:iron complex outermembrane receptor protein
MLLAAASTAVAADSGTPVGDESYFEQLPVVLTPSRLPQPLQEAPAAVTVLDQNLIRATGYRDIARLMRLVPGMQVGQERSGSNWVAYHGLGNDSPADMQVLVDGRAIYSPGIFSGVDWAALPVPIEEIERIEVVRGTNTAAYGPNAFLGVINIITRHSSDAPGYQASVSAGSPDVRDMHADWAGGADGHTIRVAATSRNDEGYQGLNDSSRINMVSLRSDHRIGYNDELTLRLAGSEARRGAGYADSVFNNNSTRDWRSQNLALQAQWRHTPAAGEELLVNFFRVQDRVRDSWTAVGPRIDLIPIRMAYVPLSQDRQSLRHSLEVQHRFAPSATTQLVWGGEASDEWLEAPLLFYNVGRVSNRLYRAFANLEWRFAREWAANIDGMVEKYSNEHARLSPRAFLNWQASPDTTFRTGYARAWRDRNDFQTHADVRAIDPVDGRVLVRPYLPNPDLRRPRIDSFEVGYLGRFRPANTTVDVRIFRERIEDFVLRIRQPITPDNPVLAMYMPPTQYVNLDSPVTLVGLEYQIKTRPYAGSQIIFNHSMVDRRTSSAVVQGRAAPYTVSLSWLQDWGGGWSSMVSVLGIGPLAGGDGYVPNGQYLAPAYTTTDFRIARKFPMGRHDVEIALAGINLGPRHQEIADRSEQYLHQDGPVNLVSRMVFLSASLSYR